MMEPIHVHVEKGGAEGKIWLEPIVKMANMHGFTCNNKQLYWVLQQCQLLNKNGMNISHNKYDAIESFIFKEGLRIASIEISPESDKLFIIPCL